MYIYIYVAAPATAARRCSELCVYFILIAFCCACLLSVDFILCWCGVIFFYCIREWNTCTHGRMIYMHVHVFHSAVLSCISFSVAVHGTYTTVPEHETHAHQTAMSMNDTHSNLQLKWNTRTADCCACLAFFYWQNEIHAQRNAIHAQRFRVQQRRIEHTHAQQNEAHAEWNTLTAVYCACISLSDAIV